MIISNSSPLIQLTKLGKIVPLLQAVSKIIIPKMVYTETIEKGLEKGYSDAIILNNLVQEKKIEIRDLTLQDRELKGYLHPGEYEAVQLALELELPLIIDDTKSRRVADFKKIDYRSTMQVMLELLESRDINYQHFQQNMNQYGKFGWVSREIIEEYLKEGKTIESEVTPEEEKGHE